MPRNRQLKWDGCDNVRDLGQLSACDGRKTRWGALVRSDAPSKLTTAWWDALWVHGIRTIISLRTAGKTEPELDLPVLPSGIESVSIAIEDLGDAEFLQQYELSSDPEREELLRARDTSSRNVILDTLANLDVEPYLLAAGLSPSDLEAARERLLEPISEDSQTS